MAITVADALKIGAMSSCKLIAGEKGIDRKISYIDTMEVPDIQPWLKKHVLLITTGYSIKDNAAGALPRLINGLNEVNAAGLAIKTRFVGGIPKDTIALADRLSLPLIEIPKEIPFVDITMPILRVIVDEHNRNLEFSERMNRKFIELELNHGGFDSIAKMLADLMNLPVVIVSCSFQVLAMSGAGKKKVPDSLLVPGHGGTPALSPSVTARILEDNILTKLETPAGTHLFVRGISVKRQNCGFLLAVCDNCVLDDMQIIALNHAATSVALEISKSQKLEEHLRYLQNNLFLDLTAGKVKGNDEAQSRAQLLHWPILPLRVSAVDINRFEKVSRNASEERIQEIKESIQQLIQSVLSAKSCTGTVMIHSDSFVILLPDTKSREELTDLFSFLCARIKKNFQLEVTVGISDPCGTYLDVVTAYGEACDAIAIARIPRHPHSVRMICDVRLEQALMKSCSQPYFRRYIEGTIGKLEEYDRSHGADLTGTLDELVENLGARQKTAETLFIHRNTLANRMKKIEEIIGMNLSDPENLFRLGVALKIRFYL